MDRYQLDTKFQIYKLGHKFLKNVINVQAKLKCATNYFVKASFKITKIQFDFKYLTKKTIS